MISNAASLLPLTSTRPAWQQLTQPPPALAAADDLQAAKSTDAEAREAFNSFVGQTFYGQMLSAMRKTQQTPAYFHGGQAEEAFRAQLDQVLAEKMAETSAEAISGPMFEMFQLARR